MFVKWSSIKIVYSVKLYGIDHCFLQELKESGELGDMLKDAQWWH